MTLLADLKKAKRGAIAKAISIMENDPKEARQLIKKIYKTSGKSIVIGITGPAGAGKSSLIQVLFRMTDAEHRENSSITIDGQNIRDIGLRLLRKSIAIIPQTSFSFSGSIRYNLDPIGEKTEGELWQVLEEVGLAK